MNRKKLDAVGAAQWIKSGKILAHPTESIWGLGCDAFIEESVNKIFYLKKRDNKKNFILLADSVDSVEKKLCYLSENDKNYLLEYWPGPYTFLINYREDIPSHLKNETNKINPHPRKHHNNIFHNSCPVIVCCDLCEGKHSKANVSPMFWIC